MGLENVNYAAMLADMKAKRAALDASISAIETALASGALGQPGDLSPIGMDDVNGTSGITGPIDLPKGALLGKSVPVAIKLYLEATKRKQKPQEIANAITELGVESISKNFTIVVGTALKRLKASGDVVLFKDGWGLSSWAPPSMRSAMQGDSGKKKKKSSKGKKAKKTAAKPNVAVAFSEPEKKEAPVSARSASDLVLESVGARQGQELSAGEIANALNLKVGSVNLACIALSRAGKLEKTPANKYRIPVNAQVAKAG